MPSRYVLQGLFLVSVFLVAALPVAAQHDHGGDAETVGDALPESFSEPIPLYPTVIGKIHMTFHHRMPKRKPTSGKGFS